MGKKRSSLTEQLEDVYINAALLKYEEQEARALRGLDAELQKQQYPDPPPPNTEFLSHIDRESKKIGSTKRWRRRLIVLIVATLLCGFLMVTILGDNIFQFLFVSYDENISINNLPVQIESESYMDWTDSYFPTYIPPGYHYESHAVGQVTIIEFEDEMGNLITFSQYSNNTQINLDNKDLNKIEHIKVNGTDGILTVKDGLVNVLWGEEPIFLITGYINYKELVKMAQSVVVKN